MFLCQLLIEVRFVMKIQKPGNNFIKHINKNWINFQTTIIILGSIIFALVLIFALNISSSTKYGMVLTVGILSFPIFFFIKYVEKTLLAAFLFALTINPTFVLLDGPNNFPIELRYSLRIHLSDILLFSLIIFWLLNHVLTKMKPEVSIWHTKIILPLTLWVGIGIVSLFPAVDTTAAIIGAIQGLRILLTFAVFFYYIREKKDVRFIVFCLLGAVLLQAVLMVAQYSTESLLLEWVGRGSHVIETVGTSSGEVFRPVGTMDHSSDFAKFSGLLMPIALSIIFFSKRKSSKFFGIVVWGFASVALVFTLSRAGLGTWFVSQLIFFLLSAYLRLITIRRWVGIFFFWFLFWSLSLAVLGGSNIKDRMSDDGGSSASRLPMMRVAIDVIKDNPLLGVGLKNYKFIYQRYDTTPERVSRSFPYQPVHNLYLLIAAETGLLGLLIFIWFIGATLKCIWQCASTIPEKVDKAIYMGIFVGIILLLAQSVTGIGAVANIVHFSTVSVLAACAAKHYLLQKQTRPFSLKHTETIIDF